MAIAATCALVVVAALAVRKPPAPKTTAASAPPVIIASAPPPSPSVVASTEPSAQVAEREPGDPEACSIEDVGNGNYTERELGIASARLFVPDPLPREYDLLLHFHGGEPVRRLVAPAKLGLVIATIDAGQGSQRYRGVVGPKLLDEISAATLAKLGAKPRHLVLSSWSAGYGAVHELLLQAPTAWRAIVLLDSLHASYDASGKADEKTLVPFFALAKRAEAEEQLLVLTHSSITPPGRRRDDRPRRRTPPLRRPRASLRSGATHALRSQRATHSRLHRHGQGSALCPSEAALRDSRR
jgi:hypothetical protein